MHIEQKFWERFFESKTAPEEDQQVFSHLSICPQCQRQLRLCVNAREFIAAQNTEITALERQNKSLQEAVERIKGERER